MDNFCPIRRSDFGDIYVFKKKNQNSLIQIKCYSYKLKSCFYNADKNQRSCVWGSGKKIALKLACFKKSNVPSVDCNKL